MTTAACSSDCAWLAAVERRVGPALAAKVRHSAEVIADTLCSYGANQLAFSFNGGKDAVVVLHLLNTLLRHIASGGVHQLTAVYFDGHDEFPEVTQFIDLCELRYGLRVIRVGAGIKQGLAEVLAVHPFQAIFLGTRRTDPHGANLGDFALTDPGWPRLMRIFPIIDWGYHDVWDFMQAENVPYCSLYDAGYAGQITLRLGI
eukprot:TRINITY_DN642_c0_g1_i1.p1 TRINITY_DN642_c0_g1~~TRINITY_DN642_c0_g1_i1.p1  ORF type:complete len:233 (+),score=60.54 TRINITY_DN642_c0_g1_i1:95-700(+)